MERINKYIASCGVCSRRKADELVLSGKVVVNEKVVQELGYKVNDTDVVKVNGKIIHKEANNIYIILNKPKGYITTSKEQFGRKSVMDLIKEKERVYPIGRLDMYTEGLLLLTNDGEFSNKLMHPTNKIEKTYIVTTTSNITDKQIEMLKSGVDIGGYITREAKVRALSSTQIEIIISEGKNRQVRKMCSSVGIKVTNLKRIKVGNIELGDLPVGKYRYLTEKEKSMI